MFTSSLAAFKLSLSALSFELFLNASDKVLNNSCPFKEFGNNKIINNKYNFSSF